MALSESGSGAQVAPITYGSMGRKATKKGVAKKSTAVRPGGKQAYYVKPRGRRK